MLSADVRANDLTMQGQVTLRILIAHREQDTSLSISRCANGFGTQDYALSRVDFSDPLAGKSTTPTSLGHGSIATEGSRASDLKKPSLVFVRSTQSNAALKRRLGS